MPYYKVIWIYHGEANEPKEYKTIANTGLDAEVKFLNWADIMLEKPVKVIRIEKVII